jgi:hypothetical protein
MASRALTTIYTLAALLPALSLPAAAADNVSRDIPSAEACTKTVNALGGLMEQKSDVSPDGRPVYRFVLRTNGLDYNVVCDAATGVVGDVSPRMAH